MSDLRQRLRCLPKCQHWYTYTVELAVLPIFLEISQALLSLLTSYGVEEWGFFMVEAGFLGSCTLGILLTCGLVVHNCSMSSYPSTIHQNSFCHTSYRARSGCWSNFIISIVPLYCWEVNSCCPVLSS